MHSNTPSFANFFAKALPLANALAAAFNRPKGTDEEKAARAAAISAALIPLAPVAQAFFAAQAERAAALKVGDEVRELWLKVFHGELFTPRNASSEEFEAMAKAAALRADFAVAEWGNRFAPGAVFFAGHQPGDVHFAPKHTGGVQ